jgi:peptidoglycan/xylan/chitin deacetylase (PgdA/CDA1 family)
MYFVKTPEILKPLAKDLLWNKERTSDTIYLTFDDGPTPDITERTLGLLEQYQAKATFFCLGKNVESHPAIFDQIKRSGHAIGNHSYNHPDGWKTESFAYLRNVVRAQEWIESSLYRPPYGHISPPQVQAIKKKFTIVMWDVISGDFDQDLTPDQCWEHVHHYAQAGSIVVFHDSVKAAPRMFHALENTLIHFGQRGFTFASL